MNHSLEYYTILQRYPNTSERLNPPQNAITLIIFVRLALQLIAFINSSVVISKNGESSIKKAAFISLSLSDPISRNTITFFVLSVGILVNSATSK